MAQAKQPVKCTYQAVLDWGEVWSLYRRHLHTYLPLLKEDGADQKEASRGW